MAGALLWLRCGPLPAGILDLDAGQSTIVVDRRGELLYEERGGDGARSIRLPADRLPAALADATIAAEDKRFWWHPGIDAIAVVRAAVHDLRRGALVEGGSTITQQTAKLLYSRASFKTCGAALSGPPAARLKASHHALETGCTRRGVGAKLREAVLALRLEHRLKKREILALYLNLASYGNQLQGAERASQEYFGRAVATLTPAEAAFLAALPQRPTTFNPYRTLSAATARQQYILQRMARLGTLDAHSLQVALDETLALRREPAAFVAPHFVRRVLATIPRPPDGRIVTTLDAELQREIQGIIRSQERALARHAAHNVAVVVLDNTTGEWLAWEGSGNYSDASHGGTIDGVMTPRQPGSALKPFTYALAFEAGETPATVLADVPSSFPTAEPGVVYRPGNYDGQFRGPMRARLALASSENVPAVALAAKVGVPDLMRFLRRAGFSTLDKTASHFGLGITLGDAEVRLDELVAAYAVFARGGAAVRPVFTRSASGEEGVSPGSREMLVSSRTAFWISDILSDRQARAYAFGRDSSLDFPFAVAAKTGTSQAYRDNWTIGYTRAITVGVWVGNFDRTPLVGSSGVTGAGPIFHAVMTAAVQRVTGRLPFDEESATIAGADGVERRAICALSGMAVRPSCPSHVEEWMPIERAHQPCDWHQSADDEAGPVLVAWPVEYRPWARDRGLLKMRRTAERAEPAENSKGSANSAGSAVTSNVGLRLVNPPAGATYLIDPTLRRDFQTLGLRASSDAGGRVEWMVDGRPIGSSESDVRFEWRLVPGAHTITARDGRGRRVEAPILVK
jgi:penicillin-binding protein 1C